MDQGKSIAALRSRVSALVEEEARLLTRAFEMSRNEAERGGVDSLFAQVQAIQRERNGLKKELGNALGTHRMHVAAEVWRVGVYDYREQIGASPVRVRVVAGALGLQVRMPGVAEPVRIELLEGSFDGPIAADDAQAHEQDEPRAAAAPPALPARKPPARTRAPKKKPT